MPAKNKNAAPAACKVCARFAPAKCKRHGGPSRSTSHGGGKGTGGGQSIARAAHRQGA